MAVLSILPGASERFKTAVSSYACGLNTKGVFSSTLGPFILGAGMTLSGSVSICEGKLCCKPGP